MILIWDIPPHQGHSAPCSHSNEAEWPFVFEATCRLRVRDANGAVVKDQQVMLSIGAPQRGEATLKLTLTDPIAYMLELMAFPVFYPRNEKSMEPFKVNLDNGRYTYRSATIRSR